MPVQQFSNAVAPQYISQIHEGEPPSRGGRSPRPRTYLEVRVCAAKSSAVILALRVVCLLLLLLAADLPVLEHTWQYEYAPPRAVQLFWRCVLSAYCFCCCVFDFYVSHQRTQLTASWYLTPKHRAP